MRRALFDRVRVLPVKGASITIDRLGFLSALLGASCTAATPPATLSAKIEHCDEEGGTYEPVADKRMYPDQDSVVLTKDASAQISIDLIGCKRYVRITPEITGTATCTYAIALGDHDREPV